MAADRAAEASIQLALLWKAAAGKKKKIAESRKNKQETPVHQRWNGTETTPVRHHPSSPKKHNSLM